MRIYKWLFNEITKLSVKYTVILALLIIVQNIMKPLVLLVYQYIASNDITIVLISVGVLFLVYIIKEIANNFADVITVKYSNLVEIHLLRRLYNSVANKNILLLNDAEYVLKLQMQIPLHRITDSASNGSVFPVVTEHFSASSDHAFL